MYHQYIAKKSHGGKEDGMSYRLLFKEVRTNFNQTELDELCFELGYDPGEVFSQPGNLSRMSQDIQEFARRRGQEQDLLQAIHEARPHLDLTSYGFVLDSSSITAVPSTTAQPKVTPKAAASRQVYVSYAWGGDSEEIVNKIDTAFQEKGIMMIRDKRDLGFKGLIKQFMQQIGEGAAVVTVISDKYLRSKNCMFELVEIADNKNFYERIFPVVLPDAKIYDSLDRIDYIKYWDSKIASLNEAMKSIESQANLQGIREDIDLYTRIRNTIAGMMDILQNMNTLTADMHEESQFAELYSAVEAKLAE